MKGQKFLKVTGILMIIGGAFGIIAGIVAILGVSGLAALSGSAAGTGLLYAASFLCLISGIVQLIAGIQGVKNCTKPELAQKCIVWGAIVAVLSVLGNVLNMVGGSGFSVTSLATGLILPALYIYGAYLNKKENQSVQERVDDGIHQWFTVTQATNLSGANPDVLDFFSITGCSMDIDENRTELKIEERDREGKTVRRSYNPPRYD